MLSSAPGRRMSLRRNDGHGFFQALRDAVVTGVTLTNVNDFRAVGIVRLTSVGWPQSRSRRRETLSSLC